MSPRVRKSSFLGEAFLGLLTSLVAAAVAATLSFVMPTSVVARLVVAGLGLAIVVRVIARSDDKTGRVATLVVWMGIAAAAWYPGIDLPAYVATHVVMAWLVRSLFSRTRMLEAGLDLGLTLLALSFAIFALVRTESVLLAVWCFFLLQALHVSVPALAARITSPRNAEPIADDPNGRFTAAFRAADEALHRIAGRD